MTPDCDICGAPTVTNKHGIPEHRHVGRYDHAAAWPQSPFNYLDELNRLSEQAGLYEETP